MDADEWVPFSARYGLTARDVLEFGHMSARHCRDLHEECEPDDRLRCVCPGTPGHGCCARATQEDRLCEACREFCWAIDSRRAYHRLIDV